MLAVTAAVAASLVAAVSAHQNLHQFWVDGVSPGYEVGIRMPPSNNPVTDVTSDDITCNVNGNRVPSGVAVVSAQAGSTIRVQWDQSSHPGPITHMLHGPVGDASTAPGLGSWVKIDELAYEGGRWANVIMGDQGMTHEFKLPSNLASGDYLLRSEMLALHASQDLDGAQFYIGCMQLRVTGPGGSCSPSIQLPGDYAATDDNIYIPDFYYGFQPSTYTAPGGPVATCGGGGGRPQPTTTVRPTTTAVPTSTTTTRPTTLSTSTTSGPTTTPGTGGGGASLYGQCGGIGWAGPTTCAQGTCTYSNDYYSQCLP